MKIFEFINIISSFFSTQIPPDSTTKRIKNSLKYQTVLTWFTHIDSDEIEQINNVLTKSDNYCNKLLNHKSDTDMPIGDANYLKSKITAENFYEIFDEADLTDESINALKKEFEIRGHPLKSEDIVMDITEVLITLLNERATVNKKTSIRSAEFLADNKLRIGKKILILPEPLKVPNLPDEIEHIYVTALLEVYSQKTKKRILSLSDLDTEPIYKANLQIHREYFYSAESVYRQIRDFFSDATQEFNNMKREVYDAIKLHISMPSSDGFDKLQSTMDLVIKVTFSKSYLSKAGNGLIGPGEQCGMVHMLVNDGVVRWL